MKIESVTIKNFRCFGSSPVSIDFQSQLTGFVGNNGSGKTALFQALSRIIGVTTDQRTVRRQDFHITPDQVKLLSGSTLSIEIIFAFPELEGIHEDSTSDAVPEFFHQMAASSPGAPLKTRMSLRATWTDDGTSEGSIDENLFWITTLDDDFNWERCPKVQAVQRGSIQLIYIPASRNASTQVTSLLKGRLWQAARWSDKFQRSSAISAGNIQKRFMNEDPLKFVIKHLEKRWEQFHEADTYTRPALQLVENQFEELIRKAEFKFFSNETGQECALVDLSDGQRSMFHIALTSGTLEAERDAFTLPSDICYFDQEKLHRVYLTLLAIEEPENNLSPFFLSRIIMQARDIAAFPSAQVILSSHSPAILSRLEPEEVRYFRFDRETWQSSVRQLKLPTNDQDARKYLRLAIRAYPELYFARFVILGEGDTEQLVIPRIAEAMNVQLDASFVPIVPLGGRYVNHFWNLLSDLHIPFATLLDFDLGRAHGGANIIRDIIPKLIRKGHKLDQNIIAKSGLIDFGAVDELEDNDLFDEYEENHWLQALELEGVFFSYPLDIDFSMLTIFPEQYKHPKPGGSGPIDSEKLIQKNKAITLKTDGKPKLYDESYDDEFKWYPYLFMNHSKPETHFSALSKIEKDELAEAPPELKALIEHVKDVLRLQDPS